MAIRTIREKGATLWFDDQLLPGGEPRLFDLAWLRAGGHLTGSSTGRNQAWFIHYRGIDLVWRHFWRGGLVGKINPDLFLRLPAEKSRAITEFRLLDWMRNEGLPVPRPVLARYQPAGLFYRADLITERIPAARPLADVLRERGLDARLWAEVGAVIAQMHAKGVHHSDLNCRNILLDAADRVWLIDFDKCERRAPGAWAHENLARLHRSFVKELGKVPELHWSEADWQALNRGYSTHPAP